MNYKKFIEGDFPFYIFFIIVYLIFINNYLHLDDGKLLNTIKFYDFDLKELFFPSHTPYYFRPVTFLSFLINKYLFGLKPFFLRIENILIHLFNCILFYYLCINLFKNKLISNFLGLIFLISPINCESVNWISGRTDLLSTFFILLSLNLIFFRKKNKYLFYFSPIFFLFGILSKENAIGYIIVAPLILFLFFKKNYKSNILFLLMLFFILFIYIQMRFPNLRIMNNKIITSSSLIPEGAHVKSNYINNNNFLVFFIQYSNIIGFYIKKTLLPWPLNFAIIKINSLWNYLFFYFTLFYLIFFKKDKKIIVLGFIWFIAFIFPALLVPLKRLAWTPVAERYLYLPQLGIFILFYPFYKYIHDKFNIGKVIILSIIVFFIVTTSLRNYIWASPERLYLDTIRKSPTFSPIYNELGVFYYENNQFKKALKYFQKALVLSKVRKNKLKYKYNILITKIKINEDNIIECYELIDKYLKDNLTDDNFKKRIAKIGIQYSNSLYLKNKRNICKNIKIKKFINKKCILFYKLLISIDPKNYFYYYRLGILYMQIGDKNKAYFYLNKVVNSGIRDYYVNAAKKILNNI